MSDEKRALTDRLRDFLDALENAMGQLLGANQPVPQPVPVQNKRRKR